MAIVITVTDIFTITIDESIILTKNKTDILCKVSSTDTTQVEIWETSFNEAKKNIIFSSLFSNFATPSGASASAIVNSISTLLIT